MADDEELRSPLDAYLQDVEAEDHILRAEPLDKRGRLETRPATSISGRFTRDALQESPAGPSTRTPVRKRRDSPSPKEPRTPYPAAVRGVQLANGALGDGVAAPHEVMIYAERFKYMICSSGLLEKDFVAQQSNDIAYFDHENRTLAQPLVASSPHLSMLHDFIHAARRILQHLWKRLLGVAWRQWLEQAAFRWDISLAVLVLFTGLCLILGGVWRVMIMSICLGSGMLAAELWPWKPPNLLLVRPHAPIAAHPSDKPITVPHLNVTYGPARTSASLQSLLASFSTLDIAISSSLEILQTPHMVQVPSLSAPYGSVGPDYIFRPLRTAIHRLTENMADHLAAAESEMKHAVDPGEVKILAEMYDIPLGGHGRSMSRNTAPGLLASPIDRASVPSPRNFASRPRPTMTTPSTVRPKRASWTASQRIHTWNKHGAGSLSSIPMHTTSSDSSYLLHRPSRHAHHLSLLPSSIRHPSRPDPDDRFTSIPLRTPRLSKRATWNPGWRSGSQELQSDDDMNMAKELSSGERDASGTPMLRTRSAEHGSVHRRRIPRERRITEVNEAEGPASSPNGAEDSLPDFGGRGLPSRIYDKANPPRLSRSGEHIPAQSSTTPSSQRTRLRPLSLPGSPIGASISHDSMRSPTIANGLKRSSPLSGSISPPDPHSGTRGGLHDYAPDPDHSHVAQPRYAILKGLSPHLKEKDRSRRSLQQTNIGPGGLDATTTATGANPNRRSLQNMTYYPSWSPRSPQYAHSDSEILASPSARMSMTPLARSTSSTSSRGRVGNSDLQALRERTATGSRRGSVHSISSVHSVMSSSRSRRNEVLFSPVKTAVPQKPDHVVPGNLHESHMYPRAGRDEAQSLGGSRQAMHPLGTAIRSAYPDRPGIQRIPSVSPLTSPALKAACLGVHLKRRRLACSLLALRWNEQDEGYWSSVSEAMDDLAAAVRVEVELMVMERVQAEAEAEKAMSASERAIDHAPPWQHSSGVYSSSSGDRDVFHFAPRTEFSDDMLDHIDALQSALGRAWSHAAASRRCLLDGHPADSQLLEASWAYLRDELGNVVRRVDKGRETLHALKLGNTQSTNEQSRIDPVGLGLGVPDIARGWSDEDDDGTTIRSTSVGTAYTASTYVNIDAPHPFQVENNSQALKSADSGSQEETLPPPGIDQVYEISPEDAHSPRIDTTLDAMTRLERIAMMKIAREQGMTLGEMMRRRRDDDGKVPEALAERAMRKQGQEVVGELKGVIGLIKEMKLGRENGARSAAPPLCRNSPATKSFLARPGGPEADPTGQPPPADYCDWDPDLMADPTAHAQAEPNRDFVFPPLNPSKLSDRQTVHVRE